MSSVLQHLLLNQFRVAWVRSSEPVLLQSDCGFPQSNFKEDNAEGVYIMDPLEDHLGMALTLWMTIYVAFREKIAVCSCHCNIKTAELEAKNPRRREVNKHVVPGGVVGIPLWKEQDVLRSQALMQPAYHVQLGYARRESCGKLKPLPQRGDPTWSFLGLTKYFQKIFGRRSELRLDFEYEQHSSVLRQVLPPDAWWNTEN